MFSVLSVLLVGLLSVSCSAEGAKGGTFKPISCYVCNSALPVGVEKCTTPLAPSGSLSLPLISQCDTPPNNLTYHPEFQGGFCRRIYQKVGDEPERTIRSCGWLIGKDESRNGCQTNKGSGGLVTTVCNCDTGDLCNSASSTSFSVLLAVFAVAGVRHFAL